MDDLKEPVNTLVQAIEKEYERLPSETEKIALDALVGSLQLFLTYLILLEKQD